MNEHVCRFGADRSLLGISSEPDSVQHNEKLPTVILLNAGLLHHVGQNRMNVTLARHLADMGYSTFRFDFSGLGDSAVQNSTAAVRERNVSEVRDAMDFLQDTRAAKSFVLIGLCTGADNAHRAAVADDRVRGIVMLDGYSYLTVKYIVKRFRNKLFSPARWKNFIVSHLLRWSRAGNKLHREAADARSFFWVLPKKATAVREIRDLLGRRVRQLQVFSGSNNAYNYAEQYVESLRGIDFGNLLRVLYIEKADHTYSILEDRSHLISEIVSWLDSGFRSERAAIESTHLIGTNPQLAGILSQPDPESEAAKKTGIVILSSGLLHRVGPFRLHVGLARSMSQAGYVVLRLDQAGRGDSSRSKGLSLAETIQRELDIAADFFRRTSGIDQLVLVGLCSGADDALALAANNENVTGLILFDGYAKTTVRYYVHYYLRRVLDLGRIGRAIKRRISSIGNPDEPTGPTNDLLGGQLVEIRNFPEPEVAVGAVKRLMQRGGSFLGVFTGDVEGYYCYEGQLRDSLEAKEYGQAFKEIYLRSAKHTYPVHDHRQLLTRLVTEWCSGRIV